MLRNRASGPETGLPGRIFGRTATGKSSKSAPLPAEGRPEGRFRCLPGGSPAKIRPGRPISGPEALLCDLVHAGRGTVQGCTGSGLEPPRAAEARTAPKHKLKLNLNWGLVVPFNRTAPSDTASFEAGAATTQAQHAVHCTEANLSERSNSIQIQIQI